MKIGILTFHNAYNYGAILQAYATQRLLKSLGYESEIIDYRNARIEKAYQGLLFDRSKVHFRKPFHTIWYYVRSCIENKKRKKIDSFKNRNLTITSNTYKQGMVVKALDYDIVLVGSDQIWNPQLTEGFDKVYFGDILKNPQTKIISWSPSSIYLDYSKDELNQLTSLIKNISSISVREVELKNIISKLTDKKVTITLDPTFIIKPKIWENLCHKVKEKNYVLVYAVRHIEGTIALAKKIAKTHHKTLVIIQSYIKPDFHPYIYNTCSPEDFLSYFYYADYVVTSSFHGTTFSILFKKQFINYVPKSNKDSRVLTIMNALGLESRAADENYNINSISDKIDYIESFKRLDVIRKDSINFLSMAINNQQ